MMVVTAPQAESALRAPPCRAPRRVKVMHPLRHIPARTAAVAAGTAAAALALAAVAAPATPAGATDTPSASATAEYQAALKAVGPGRALRLDRHPERGHARRER